MAEPDQEEGWPLGLLQPIMPINRDHFSGSISFNTLLTASPTSSTYSSSDLDTVSTGSFFHDKSITLGSLIGVTSIVELSRRSLRLRKNEPSKEKTKRSKTKTKTKAWCVSLCASNGSIGTESPKTGPSLGHFLEVERKASNGNSRNRLSPEIYAPDELALAQPVLEPNSLFVNGFIAPPRPDPCSGTDKHRVRETGCGGIGSLFSSCIFGQRE